MERVRSVLLGLTGMEIRGGIACVARCVAQALDDEVRDGRIDRVDRVLLHDREPTTSPPERGEERVARGSQARFVLQLWQMFRRHRHDLVFFDIYGLARSLELPLPGFPPPRTAIFTHAFELDRGFGALRGRALRRATHVLANSEYSARVLRELYPRIQVPIRAVHLCIDPRRVRDWNTLGEPDPAASRKPIVAIVSRISRDDARYKGHDTLLDAWPGVLEAVPDAQLHIAGSGNDTERLRHRSAEKGLGSHVVFAGELDTLGLTDLYRRAAVYAMPSRQEGFGIVFAEAMWHGLPCIGTTEDASGEVIEDGVSGLLVPYGDARATTGALRRLLIDSELRVRLGQAGFRRVRQKFGYDDFRRRLGQSLQVLPGEGPLRNASNHGI